MSATPPPPREYQPIPPHLDPDPNNLLWLNAALMVRAALAYTRRRLDREARPLLRLTHKRSR